MAPEDVAPEDVAPEDVARDAVPARTAPTGWKVIVVCGLWAAVIWSVRVVNLWQDLMPSFEEKLWRTGLAATFVVLGVAVAVIGWGLRRWPATAGDRAAVGILAGWTLGIWASRTVALVGGGHAAAFVVVHLVLAAVSVALVALAWRAVVAASAPADEDSTLEPSAT
jgi:hypothetical protein